MSFLKNYWLSCVLFALGVVCLVAYNIIGSSVDDEGMLVESFFLIPLSYVFQALGIITFAVTLLRKRRSGR